MKTIRSILRELLGKEPAGQKTEAAKQNQSSQAEETAQSSENQQTVFNSKSQPNETDDHEVDGSGDMAASGNQETPETALPDSQSEERQGMPAPESSDREKESGEQAGTESDAEPSAVEQSAGEPDNSEFQKALEEAYQRGVIDGRNAQIEEKYFPSKDDGIPQFPGRTPASKAVNDIFSLAREA